MGARLVIMDQPILRHLSEMTLTQRNQEIQTVPPEATDQSFAMGIRLGRSEGRLKDSHSQGSYRKIQLLRVNTVPIVNQKAVALVVVNRLAKLLQGPSGRGMGSDVEME